MTPLPDFLQLEKISYISLLILALIQYVKTRVPDWIIKPYLQVFFGLALAWWWDAYGLPAGTPFWSVNWITVISNGILAAIFADTGFNFLSSKPGSPVFSFPRKTTPDPSGTPGG